MVIVLNIVVNGVRGDEISDLKMITLFQIDKSGSDIFEKDYSIVLAANKKEVYGINIPQEI